MYSDYSERAERQRYPTVETNIKLQAEIIKQNRPIKMLPEDYNNFKNSLKEIENSIADKNRLIAKENSKRFTIGTKKGELQKALNELKIIQTQLKVLLALYAAPITEEEKQELIEKMNERYDWPDGSDSENRKKFENDRKIEKHADQYYSSEIIKPYDTNQYRVFMRKQDFDDDNNENFYKYLENIEANVNNTELLPELKNKFRILKEVYPQKYYTPKYYGGKRRTRKHKKPLKKGKSRKSSRK